MDSVRYKHPDNLCPKVNLGDDRWDHNKIKESTKKTVQYFILQCEFKQTRSIIGCPLLWRITLNIFVFKNLCLQGNLNVVDNLVTNFQDLVINATQNYFSILRVLLVLGVYINTECLLVFSTGSTMQKWSLRWHKHSTPLKSPGLLLKG